MFLEIGKLTWSENKMKFFCTPRREIRQVNLRMDWTHCLKCHQNMSMVCETDLRTISLCCLFLSICFLWYLIVKWCFKCLKYTLMTLISDNCGPQSRASMHGCMDHSRFCIIIHYENSINVDHLIFPLISSACCLSGDKRCLIN